MSYEATKRTKSVGKHFCKNKLESNPRSKRPFEIGAEYHWKDTEMWLRGSGSYDMGGKQ